MTRRGFLAVVAGVVGAGLISIVEVARPGYLLGRLRRLEGFGRTPVRRLRNHFAWLDVDPVAFETYVADYQTYYRRLDRLAVPDPRFYTRFLLSTDFFSNGGDRKRLTAPVRYTVFYEPGVTPCHNPLARSPLSDAELGESAGWAALRRL